MELEWWESGWVGGSQRWKWRGQWCVWVGGWWDGRWSGYWWMGLIEVGVDVVLVGWLRGSVAVSEVCWDRFR